MLNCRINIFQESSTANSIGSQSTIDRKSSVEDSEIGSQCTIKGSSTEISGSHVGNQTDVIESFVQKSQLGNQCSILKGGRVIRSELGNQVTVSGNGKVIGSKTGNQCTVKGEVRNGSELKNQVTVNGVVIKSTIGNASTIDGKVTNSEIGSAVDVDTDSTVDGATVGDRSTIKASTLSLKSATGVSCFVLNATINKNVRLGDNVVVGVGAVLEQGSKAGDDVCIEDGARLKQGKIVKARGMVDGKGVVSPPPGNANQLYLYTKGKCKLGKKS